MLSSLAFFAISSAELTVHHSLSAVRVTSAQLPKSGSRSFSLWDTLGDDGGGSNTSPITAFQGTGITASDDLWWFGGVTPANYSVVVNLVAIAGGPGTYQWTIASETGIVTFGNGSSSYNSVNDNTAVLKSIGSSASGTNLPWDVTLNVSRNNTQIGSARLSVAKPDHLNHVKDTDQADANWTYFSTIYYKVADQFNRVMPRKVEVNEQWATGVLPDFQGMD